MMKVAIVSITRTHLLNLAIALDKKEDTDVTFYTLTPTKRLRSFGYDGKVVNFAFPLGIIFFIIHKLPLSYKNGQRAGHKLRKWFDKFCSWAIKPCDVLIGENGDAYYTTLVAKKKFNPIAICDQGSEHILTQDESFRNLGLFINPWNTTNLLNHYSVCDYIMTPSEYVKTTDIEHGISLDKILYNPYGVDPELFQPTQKPKKDAYDVIMVGNWCLRKSCDLLSQSILESGLSLLHVGAVTNCPFPVSDKCTDIGLVQERELPIYYAQAKVFILPSRNEGFGLVLSQAVACGLPIVYSTGTGGPEINRLMGGKSACFEIANPISAETISAALKKAIEYANNLPGGIRQPYGDEFQNVTWAAYGERYHKILIDIINRR